MGTQQTMQTHHSNLQQHHQMSLHTSNVSISGTSSCQQQNQGNYPQQNQRHQTQDRISSNPSSYSLVDNSTSRNSVNNSQNLPSSHHLNESYCQTSFVAV